MVIKTTPDRQQTHVLRRWKRIVPGFSIFSEVFNILTFKDSWFVNMKSSGKSFQLQNKAQWRSVTYQNFCCDDIRFAVDVCTALESHRAQEAQKWLWRYFYCTFRFASLFYSSDMRTLSSVTVFLFSFKFFFLVSCFLLTLLSLMANTHFVFLGCLISSSPFW